MNIQDIENFAEEVNKQIEHWFANIGFRKRKLTDTPTDDLHVVNKKYVDDQISGKFTVDVFPQIGYIGTGNPGTNSNLAIWSLTNNQDTQLYIPLRVPAGANNLSSVKVYYINQSASADAVRLRGLMSTFNPDSLPATLTLDSNDVVRSYTNITTVGDIDAFTINSASYDGITIVPQDYLSFSLIRKATEVADTYEADLEVVFLRFIFS